MAFIGAESSYIVGPNTFCISTIVSICKSIVLAQEWPVTDGNWPSYSACFIDWCLFCNRCPLISVGINVCQYQEFYILYLLSQGHSQYSYMNSLSPTFPYFLFKVLSNYPSYQSLYLFLCQASFLSEKMVRWPKLCPLEVFRDTVIF